MSGFVPKEHREDIVKQVKEAASKLNPVASTLAYYIATRYVIERSTRNQARLERACSVTLGKYEVRPDQQDIDAATECVRQVVIAYFNPPSPKKR